MGGRHADPIQGTRPRSSSAIRAAARFSRRKQTTSRPEVRLTCHPWRWPGVVPVRRLALRLADAGQDARIRRGRDSDPGARHRRQHGHFQLRRRHPAEAPALQGRRPHRSRPRKAAARRPQRHLDAELPRLAARQRGVRIHGGPDRRAGHDHRRRRSGAGPRRPRLGALLRHLRHPSPTRPHLPARRGPAGEEPRRDSQSRAVGDAVRIGSRQSSTARFCSTTFRTP